MSLAEASSVHAANPTDAAKKKSPDALILLAVLILVAMWGLSVFLFGIPGLYIPALGSVPVVWIILLAITQG